MSWSVQAIGKPAAVATAIEQQFASSVCGEPEEGVRQSARAVIAGALAAQKPNSVVNVTASGSMSRDSWPDGPVTNTLSIKVEPQYGFVE